MSSGPKGITMTGDDREGLMSRCQRCKEVSLTRCSIFIVTGQSVDDVVLQWLRLNPFIDFISSPPFPVFHALQ